jgi:hypothetical protein
MGKNASARVKSKVKNKFIRALRKIEAQEFNKEQFFKERKRKAQQAV